MVKGKLVLINPVGKPPDEANTVASPVGDLSGKRIGLRTDDMWKAFDVFSNRIEEDLKRKYPTVEIARFRNTSGGRAVSHDGSPEFLSFAEGVDGAIVGLGG